MFICRFGAELCPSVYFFHAATCCDAAVSPLPQCCPTAGTGQSLQTRDDGKKESRNSVTAGSSSDWERSNSHGAASDEDGEKDSVEATVAVGASDDGDGGDCGDGEAAAGGDGGGSGSGDDAKNRNSSRWSTVDP